MFRDFQHINEYLNELGQDIYPQPVDPGHLEWATEFIDFIQEKIGLEGKEVFDVGCGVGFVAPLFLKYGAYYSGVTLHPEDVSTSKHPTVIGLADFHFLGDTTWDIVFSRHSLEHSPMPLLALMEWYRVSKKYLCLVLPSPNHFGEVSRNHYSVMSREQAGFLLRRSGWNILHEQSSVEEIRLICEKIERPSPFYIGPKEINNASS